MTKIIDTASSVGLGDPLPKPKVEIYFLTYFIPIIAGSFVIYLNLITSLF